MPTFVAVWWSRLRAFLQPAGLAADFDQELESHLAMAEEDKIRQGLTPAQARREARQELGGLTQLRDAAHEARGLPGLEAYWLDVKLGLRMLRKSWGLTLIGGLAMTIVIAVALVAFAVVEVQFRPTLPLEEGDRVVALQTWDARAHRRHPTSLRDLELWTEGLRSVEDVGAFQTVVLPLSSAGPSSPPGPRELVQVAQMSASGFRLARVAPLHGRPLVDEDEHAGAEPVVVIGAELWHSRLGGDPGVLGRQLYLGGIAHTVVGIMPEPFAFPVNHHLWVPLRADASEPTALLGDGDGEGVVFARLGPNATIADAQAELATLGLLALPEGDEELEPRVVPYTLALTGDVDRTEVRWLIRLVVVLGVLLLVPPCANIAILVYARTVTRQGEFAARHALGASRGRIVTQLFIEMLVLTGVATVVALVLARVALGWAEAIVRREIPGGPPFWMDFDLSWRMVAFAGLLAVCAALIAAVVPALKATGRQMQSGLRALGSRAGLQLGATWTALVVIQVALTLATLPSAIEIGWGTIRQGVLGPGFAAERFLTARIEAAQGQERDWGLPVGELVRALTHEAGVAGASVAASLPGDEEWARVEVTAQMNPGTGVVTSTSLARTNRVDSTFFDTLQMSVLAGRALGPADQGPAPTAVVVNQTFVREVLGDAEPLGQRVRYLPTRAELEHGKTADSAPWLEIVGVVEDRPANTTGGTLYHPLPLRLELPLAVVADSGSAAGDLGRRLAAHAAAIDPGLVVDEVRTLAQVYREHQVANNVGALSLAVVTLSILLLSAAGMYALLSFTVNQRRREIGIRAALGAPARLILATIFRRAALQVGSGGALGVLVALVLDHSLPAESVGGWEVPGVIPSAAVLLLVVAILAAIGPARRALRVAPIDELREG
jgi:predicted permease